MERTQMEAQALFEARRAFAEALVKCGSVNIEVTGLTKIGLPGGQRWPIQVIDVFAKLSPKQIDMVIEDTWNALRASMTRQSAAGEIPFPLETSDGGSTSTAAQSDNGQLHQDSSNGSVPYGYFRNPAGHLLKKGLTDDEIPY